MVINLLREGNFEVTNKYLDTIAQALKKTLEKGNNDVKIVEYSNLKELKKLGKKEIIIVSTVLEGIKLLMRGYSNIIIWFQGIVPEESYMKNNSMLKKFILGFIEKYCLKKSKFKIFVSNLQKEHYEKKYKIIIRDNYFVMPCFNAEYNKKAFKIPNKYKNNRFCYIGSTAKWQQFEEITNIYKQIENRVKDSEFIVLTSNIDEAKTIISKYDINNFVVKHVSPDLVSKEIEKCKYGFVLRDDCMVNRVATPTKLCNYMSCGVIPIFSKCLNSFYEVSKNLKNVICIEQLDNSIDTIVSHTKKVIDIEQMSTEYKTVFDRYYNFDYYQKELKKEFDKIY